MRHSTQYLYEINPSELRTMPYELALKHKISSAKKLISKLLEPDYRDRDDQRINAVFAAIKFNNKLLKELSC